MPKGSKNDGEKRETGNGKRETGNGKRETGNGKRETKDRYFLSLPNLSLKKCKGWVFYDSYRYKHKSKSFIMLHLNHKKLKAWKKSILLVKEIYRLTENFPDSEKFSLTNQLRRAAVSVSSNISEGASRKSKIERIRFYEIARSSLVEIDTQIEISIELEYLYKENLTGISELLNANFALITNMIKG